MIVGTIILAALTACCAADVDTLLKPAFTAGNPVGLILIQGAEITTAQYVPLALALQSASAVYNISLFVAIPAFVLDLPEPLQIGSAIAGSKSALEQAGLSAAAPIILTGHSLGGAMVQDFVAQNPHLAALQILMGAGLERKYINGSNPPSYPVPTLNLGGTLDGLYRFTRQAEGFQHWVVASGSPNFPVVSFEGVSHMQFANGSLPPLVRQHDLEPEVSYDAAHALIANVAAAFLAANLLQSPQAHTTLAAAVNATSVLAAPVIAALQLEGFKHFQKPCDSDYPMPNCPAYPIYPGKPQGNTVQVNCTCGTPWSALYSQPTHAGGLANITVVAVDAIHSVSDIHPVHLPHVWSNYTSCTSTPCAIRVTTVTEAVYATGDSLDTGFAPIAATELRTKLKSRQALWEAAGLTNVNFTETDVTANLCADINARSYQWALAHSSAAALTRYNKIGQKMTMGPDIFLGNAGPLWIDNPLELNVVNDTVIVNAPCNHVPTKYLIGEAAGKVLSPARALEWIYIDSLRAHGSVKP